jgi:dihydrofolate synthase / folylpolyglutamate synthase
VSDQRAWIESLSPWPEEFGLGRMRALLSELGEPQLAYPAIHVVGTNGKSTTTRMTEAILGAEGLAVGAYVSPHARSWSERIRVRGEEANFEHALARIRRVAEAAGATQFEALTAAALLEFAEAGVDVAVVEAGLGGRLDATNVLRSEVVVLTNIGLEHTDVLGETREEIAAEKLAVVQPGSVVVLCEPEWADLARENGAERIDLVSHSNLALATTAAEAFLGRPADPRRAQELRLPGRLEVRSEAPLEIWDGAHTLDGVGYLLSRIPTRAYVIVASMLADKAVEAMLAALSVLGERLVATRSSNARALSAGELAGRAAPYFAAVEAIDDPRRAVEHARDLAGSEGAVLVTGSLYLLADLAVRLEDVPWGTLARG